MRVELTGPNELAGAPGAFAIAAGVIPATPATTSAAPESARGRYVFAALLLLIALTAIPYGAAAPWWESLFECGVFALGIVWVCGALRRGEPPLKGDPLLYPALALLAFACVQTLPVDVGGATAAAGIQAAREAGASLYLSADPFETWRFVLKLLALVVAGGLLRACVRGSESRLRTLVRAVVAIGLASAAFALARQALQAGGGGFGLPLLSAGTGYGQFVNHNHFALLMEMTWGLLLGVSFGGGRRGRLPLYVAAGALMWAALVLSNSRGGIFSMLGQLCFFAALWPGLLGREGWREDFKMRRRSSKGLRAVTPRSVLTRVVLGACLLCVTTFGVVWVGGDALAGRMDELPRELRAAEDVNPRLRVRRVEMWKAAWRLFKADPAFGAGFGGFANAVTEYYDASGNWTLKEAHNEYLELLASGGLVGAALALWFVVALARGARGQMRLRGAFGRAACRGALVGLCGVALHSLVDFGLHLTVNACVCVALVVVATAQVGRGEGAVTDNTNGLLGELAR